ncbi:tautomerase family protein [Paraglaciecola chathamensis]|uniref:4-oxalocrotonate tautomerase-like domain-containing protein n=1 Tax=Paraglaciecola agarilytica NO2 TaxID=1125747 RepID=A0ABQ0IA90_9ALTE|nr:tautomerase family protein [Paraglaciecola agarilytica]GAC06220.1 hypothetical protein GAGA_3386 [Paraglaciecola agarilytica NO2]
MPLVNFNLLKSDVCESQIERLIKQSSELYADVLECPIERVRIYINLFDRAHVGVAGDLVAFNHINAPYFDFIVLDGRSLDQRRRLAEGFTDLLVSIFAVDKSLIRGSCRKILPEDWSIGGILASELRKNEIQNRAEATQKN